MEVFCGKWQVTGDLQNLDNFLAAIGASDSKAQFAQPYVYEVSYEGNVFNSVTQVKGQAPAKLSTKLGEKMKTFSPCTGDAEICVTLEGDNLVAEQNFSTHKQIARSRVEGNKLIVDTSANGVTYTRIFEKIQ